MEFSKVAPTHGVADSSLATNALVGQVANLRPIGGAPSARPAFALYAWIVLAYNLAVVMWGAFVRATGSGAGCGNHWPMCNGELIPHSRPIATLIELAHRLSSGIALILIIGLIVWAFRAFPAGHPARKGAAWSVFFTFTEALIGAGLVLFEKVAKDQSFSRVVSLSVHLINTFLLVAALALTAWWASGMPALSPRRSPWRTAALIGLAGTLILGISGAITALGDTLYPSASLAEGLRADFAATAHFLVRFRKFHPLIAVLVGSYLAVFAFLARKRASGPMLPQLSTALISLIAIQWGLGTLDVALLAPVWLQLIHLLLADLLWIAAVLLAASV